MPVTPIGPELRSTGKASPSAALPTPEQRRQMVESTLATQFETIAAAARGCDVIVGATALQIAAPSVAERMSIPYVFAAYCPTVLPSPHHAPPVLSMLGDTPARAPADYAELWAQDARRWHDTWGPLLNSHRAALGLEPVSDVRSHVLTDQPWLAADPSLAPWPEPADRAVVPTRAWILPDERPLSPELETFLATGEPPVYFGFGSIRAPEDLSQVMIKSARVLGRRALVSRGWADLSLADDDPTAWPSARSTSRRCSDGSQPSSTTAARAGAPRAPIHHGQAVQDCLATGGAARIQLESLPGDAPDLNPDEGIWNYLKRVERRNRCCATLRHLRHVLRLATARLRHKRCVIHRCFHQRATVFSYLYIDQ